MSVSRQGNRSPNEIAVPKPSHRNHCNDSRKFFKFFGCVIRDRAGQRTGLPSDGSGLRGSRSLPRVGHVAPVVSFVSRLRIGTSCGSFNGSNRDVRDECILRCAPERERYAPVEVVITLCTGSPAWGAAARSVGFIACLVRRTSVPPPAESMCRGRGYGRAASASQRPQDRLVDSQVCDGPLETGMFRPDHCSLRHHRSAGTLQKQKIFYVKYRKV